MVWNVNCIKIFDSKQNSCGGIDALKVYSAHTDSVVAACAGSRGSERKLQYFSQNPWSR